MTHLLQFDGLAVPNPGEITYGAILFSSEEIPWVEQGNYEPMGTNNEAEYKGLLLGLHLAKERGIQHLRVEGDSKLVIEQVSNRWKVNHPRLIPLHREVLSIIPSFASIAFHHVPREKNREADRITNEVFQAKKGYTREYATKGNVEKIEKEEKKEEMSYRRPVYSFQQGPIYLWNAIASTYTFRRYKKENLPPVSRDHLLPFQEDVFVSNHPIDKGGWFIVQDLQEPHRYAILMDAMVDPTTQVVSGWILRVNEEGESQQLTVLKNIVAHYDRRNGVLSASSFFLRGNLLIGCQRHRDTHHLLLFLTQLDPARHVLYHTLFELPSPLQGCSFQIQEDRYLATEHAEDKKMDLDSIVITEKELRLKTA